MGIEGRILGAPPTKNTLRQPLTAFAQTKTPDDRESHRARQTNLEKSAQLNERVM